MNIFSITSLKTSFFNQSNGILALIWSVDHTSLVNVCCNMTFQNKIVLEHFKGTLRAFFQNLMIGTGLLFENIVSLNTFIVWHFFVYLPINALEFPSCQILKNFIYSAGYWKVYTICAVQQYLLRKQQLVLVQDLKMRYYESLQLKGVQITRSQYFRWKKKKNLAEDN